MNDPQDDLHMHTERIAKAFPYPTTPNLARQLFARRRQAQRLRVYRLAITALISLLLMGGLLTVPTIRAELLALLRIGAIEFITQDTIPTAQPIDLHLTGKTTLEAAQNDVEFLIRLPTALQSPDAVFLQHTDGAVVILIWFDSAGQPEFVLYQIHDENFGIKIAETLESTVVHGNRAVWVEGEHILQFLRGTQVQIEPTRLIASPVLVWREGEITYRLEAQITLEEAVRIAESLE